MKLRTVGFSKKVLATVLAACGGQLIAFCTTLLATGSFDRVEAAQLLGVALTAALGVVAGYAAPANPVEPAPDNAA